MRCKGHAKALHSKGRMTEKVNEYILYTRITFYLVYTSAKRFIPEERGCLTTHFLCSVACLCQRQEWDYNPHLSSYTITILLSCICGKKGGWPNDDLLLLCSICGPQAGDTVQAFKGCTFLCMASAAVRSGLPAAQCAASGQTGRQIRGKYWSTSRSCLIQAS